MATSRKLSLEEVSQLPDRVFFLEYIYCVLFFVFLFFALALASFDPSDPSLFNFVTTAAPNIQESLTSNLFGPFGATVADWFFQLFGIGSLIFSGVFIAQLLASFRMPKSRSRFWLRAFGYPQLIICYLGLLCAIATDYRFKGIVFYSGGIIGFKVYSFFASLFGSKGAGVALLFGVLASLPLCLGLRPVNLVLMLLGKVPNFKLKNSLLTALEKDSAKSETADAEQNSVTFREALRVPAPQVGEADNREPLCNKYEPLSEDEPSYSKVVNPGELRDLINLLEYHASEGNQKDPAEEQARLKGEARVLEEKMATYGVTGTVVRSQPGPVVNVHEFEPAAGIKVTKVLGLQDDLALGLKAQSVIMAPQPGKSTIGIEVPSPLREVVSLRELMETSLFQNHRAPLPMVLGKHVDGSPLIADLSGMPHLLVAGATGSGKSVGVNGMLLSLMMSRTPQQLRLILVDPKMLELSNYDGIGHLLMPVVTEPQKAAAALKWAIQEMEKRYKLMKVAQVRNIASYNTLVEEAGGSKEIDGAQHEVLPYIVVVIDELCDLMMTAPKDVEESVQRLAQKARAAGIHLVLATQRPSVDVLTGVIKANLPCRISYQVTSKHDSRTIIESIGAERLLGKGDMLFLPPGTNKLVRAHGAYVGDREINAVADKLRALYPPRYETRIMDEVDRVSREMSQKNDERGSGKVDGFQTESGEIDENTLYDRAVELALSSGKISTSSIQRAFHIGYNRAARIMDRMVKEGLVGGTEVAGKPREVIAPQR